MFPESSIAEAFALEEVRTLRLRASRIDRSTSRTLWTVNRRIGKVPDSSSAVYPADPSLPNAQFNSRSLAIKNPLQALKALSRLPAPLRLLFHGRSLLQRNTFQLRCALCRSGTPDLPLFIKYKSHSEHFSECSSLACTVIRALAPS